MENIGGDLKIMTNYPFVVHRSGRPDDKIQLQRYSPSGFTHQHIFFEFIYVLKGTAVREMPDAQIPVCAGDYYISNPRSAHGYSNMQNFEIVSCHFLPEYLDRALSNCPSMSLLLSNQFLRFGVPTDLPIADRVFHDIDGSVRQIVRQMENEQAEHPTGYLEMLRCYLTQILVNTVRAYEVRTSNNAINKVVDYLQVHYANPLSLATLADLTGYTPQYLSGLFSREVGMSIQKFLVRVRIAQAGELLDNTNMSVAEIANAVGYQDIQHFSRLFRQHQKQSPRAYRKTVRKENAASNSGGSIE